MAKNLFLACLVLLLVQHSSQSAPIAASSNYSAFVTPFTDFSTVQGAQIVKPTTTWATSSGSRTSAIFPITIKTSNNALSTTIYARLSYEDEVQVGYGLYGDVVVRFYQDASASIPFYVSGLSVNYRIISYDGYNIYDNNYSATVSGEAAVIASWQEHDYNDGTIQRWKDYHLLAGTGYVAQ